MHNASIRTHLLPILLTLIVVSWVGGQVINTALRRPDDRDCRLVEGQQRIGCFAARAKMKFREQGLDAALGLYDAYMKAGVGCHYSLMHPMGEAAYDEFSRTGRVVVSPLLTACNYAFFHGFIGELYRTGRGTAEALEFCKRIGRELSPFAPAVGQECFHGIGHGLVDHTAHEHHGDARAMAAATLPTCETLVADAARLGNCVSGVFHAISLLTVAGEAGLDIRRDDPLWLCREQPERYQPRCYGLMHRIVVAIAPQDDFRTAAAFIERAYGAQPAVRDGAIWYLAYNLGTGSLAKNDGSRNIFACRAIPEATRGQCIDGFTQGFAHHGIPRQEYKRSLGLCRLDRLSTAERDRCWGALFYAFYRTYPPEIMRDICSDMTDPRIYCNLELGYRNAWNGSQNFVAAMQKAGLSGTAPAP